MSLKALTASLSKTGAGAIVTPHLTEHLFKRRRELESGAITRTDLLLKDCRRSIKCLKRKMAEFDHDSNANKIPGAFHPSSMGRCRRMMWFDYFKAPRQPESRLEVLKMHMIFEFGSYFHMFFQNLCADAGILVRREVPVVLKDPSIQGHCDGILRINGVLYVLELKTINSYSFGRLDGPEFEHKQQAMTYMYVLRKKPRYANLQWAAIVYFDKGTSQLKEYVVRYDAEFMEQNVVTEIKRFHEALDLKKIPNRISEDPTKRPCAECPYHDLCYNDVRLRKFIKHL